MLVSKEVLTEAVRKAAINNNLTCEQAHELCKELGVELWDIGEVCNELKIKIKACQLGCF